MSDGELNQSVSIAPLPWQRSLWQGVVGRHRAGRLPHAMLLHGAPGTGKRHLLASLTQALLCQQPLASGAGCGECNSCRLIAAGTHPALVRIGLLERPGDEGKLATQISIDQIRELGQQMTLTTRSDSYRLVIIDPADKMNVNASNALLKTLEEPGGGNLLLLVSERPAGLPATIRSRCQSLHLTAPPREQALEWLAAEVAGVDHPLLLDLSAGAPLTARARAESGYLEWRERWIGRFISLREGRIDPLEAARDLVATGEAERALAELAGWLVDILRMRIAAGVGVVNRDRIGSLARHFDPFTHVEITRRHQRLVAQLRLLEGSVNRQLLLEGVMMEWSSVGG